MSRMTFFQNQTSIPLGLDMLDNANKRSATAFCRLSGLPCRGCAPMPQQWSSLGMTCLAPEPEPPHPPNGPPQRLPPDLAALWSGRLGDPPQCELPDGYFANNEQEDADEDDLVQPPPRAKPRPRAPVRLCCRCLNRLMAVPYSNRCSACDYGMCLRDTADFYRDGTRVQLCIIAYAVSVTLRGT